MGVPVEFVSREYLFVEPVSEMLAFGSHAVPKGCWSDDTSMVLATIDSMVQCKEVNYNDIADKFLDWLSEAKYTSTDKIFDI
jgi:ADP-ribosylglycohydrolase